MSASPRYVLVHLDHGTGSSWTVVDSALLLRDLERPLNGHECKVAYHYMIVRCTPHIIESVAEQKLCIS